MSNAIFIDLTLDFKSTAQLFRNNETRNKPGKISSGYALFNWRALRRLKTIAQRGKFT